MKLRTPPTQEPMRTFFLTAGSVSGFAFFALAMAPAASVAGVMSGMIAGQVADDPVLVEEAGFLAPLRAVPQKLHGRRFSLGMAAAQKVLDRSPPSMRMFWPVI